MSSGEDLRVLETIEADLTEEDIVDILGGDVGDHVDDDEFCHIESGDGKTYYCGRRARGETTCPYFRGEAICPGCGRATCPRCAVMSNLNDRLEFGEVAS